MISAGGGGAAYTLASGNFSVPSVLNTALLLGLVSGGFYKVWSSLLHSANKCVLPGLIGYF